MSRACVAVLGMLILGVSAVAVAQPAETPLDPPLANWTAPPYWTPPAAAPRGSREGRMVASAESMAAQAESLPSSPVPFTAITPCRVADTRGNGFTGEYGPPSLAAALTRDFTIAGQCGIPTGAVAVSFNFTVVNGTASGDLRFYPTGGSMPLVSTINWNATTGALANAAVVPLGTGGAITVKNDSAASVNLVIDVNGYYGPSSVVTSLNTLAGDVILEAGSNVTITPSGQTLTIAATGGPGGVLPSGTAGQTLYSDGTSWLPSSTLTNDGSSNVGVNGDLNLPATTSSTNGVVNFGGYPFLHDFGGPGSDGQNMFLGQNAGNFSMGGTGSQGSYNIGIGSWTLSANTTGTGNTAIGWNDLSFNTTGSRNTATGYGALLQNTTGSFNTATGYSSLTANTTGLFNTANSYGSLSSSTTGSLNTAVGFMSMLGNTTGSSNIAIGANAGSSLTTGNDNIDIGNQGSAGEAATIRLGDALYQTRTFIAGIRGVTTDNTDAIPVVIDSAGQLGTVSSSIRFKQDVADMGSASSKLMELRPVTFHYKAHPDGPLQYGLIAEEVARVMPSLVIHDATGQIETVAYQELPAMLLNEVQKQHATIEAQQAQLDAQQARIQALEAKLAELEALQREVRQLARESANR